MLERTVESCSIGVAFSQSPFTDLDFADDVSLLAELLELLVPILETMASEAASLGLEVNWQKTSTLVQALGCREDMPLTIKVQGQDVMVVEEFVYLGSLILQHPEALVHQPPKCHHPCCHAELRKSDLEVTARYLNEVEAYNTCILPIFLYGSDSWAISKTDARRIDALDQWCLRMLLGIKMVICPER